MLISFILTWNASQLVFEFNLFFNLPTKLLVKSKKSFQASVIHWRRKKALIQFICSLINGKSVTLVPVLRNVFASCSPFFFANQSFNLCRQFHFTCKWNSPRYHVSPRLDNRICPDFLRLIHRCSPKRDVLYQVSINPSFMYFN